MFNTQVEYRINGGDWVTAESDSDVALFDSTFISSSGVDNTSTLLTPPEGVNATDFVAGVASDDSNPAPVITLLEGEYTEVEFNLRAISGISKDDVVELRVTDDGAELHKYPVIPQVTMTSENLLWSLPASNDTVLSGLEHSALRRLSVQATDASIIPDAQYLMLRMFATQVNNGTVMPAVYYQMLRMLSTGIENAAAVLDVQQQILRFLSTRKRNAAVVSAVQHQILRILNTRIEYRINGGSWVHAGHDSDIAFRDSAFISASGVDETAPLLTPRAGVTTADFVEGAAFEDSDSAPVIKLPECKYTEIEFNLKAVSGINKDDLVEIRVTDDGADLYEYTVTPQVTMTSGNRVWAIPASNSAILSNLEQFVLRRLNTRMTDAVVVSDMQQQLVHLLSIAVEHAVDITSVQPQVLRLLLASVKNSVGLSDIQQQILRLVYYGPPGSDEDPNFDKFSTPAYLSGYANKIRSDLNKMARMYNGRRVRLFQVDEESAHCRRCRDVLTGKVISSECPLCNGTGYITGYTRVPGDFYIYGDIVPVTLQATPVGNVERGNRDVSFSLIYGPLLEQNDLIVTVATKDVYKLEKSDPDITAMKGEIIMQTALCALLTQDRAEYRVINW